VSTDTTYEQFLAKYVLICSALVPTGFDANKKSGKGKLKSDDYDKKRRDYFEGRDISNELQMQAIVYFIYNKIWLHIRELFQESKGEEEWGNMLAKRKELFKQGTETRKDLLVKLSEKADVIFLQEVTPQAIRDMLSIKTHYRVIPKELDGERSQTAILFNGDVVKLKDANLQVQTNMQNGGFNGKSSLTAVEVEIYGQGIVLMSYHSLPSDGPFVWGEDISLLKQLKGKLQTSFKGKPVIVGMDANTAKLKDVQHWRKKMREMSPPGRACWSASLAEAEWKDEEDGTIQKMTPEGLANIQTVMKERSFMQFQPQKMGKQDTGAKDYIWTNIEHAEWKDVYRLAWDVQTQDFAVVKGKIQNPFFFPTDHAAVLGTVNFQSSDVADLPARPAPALQVPTRTAPALPVAFFDSATRPEFQEKVQKRLYSVVRSAQPLQ
jgi:hypothetical protein